MDTPDDEVARRFRENDTLGDPSSFWYRATRQFFEEHKPVGKMQLLSAGPTMEEQLPLGLFTYTKRDRLIYWPALAKGKVMVSDGKESNVVDHITLEFPSEKMHLTYIKEDGTIAYVDEVGARSYPFEGLNIAHCFQVLAKIDILQSQETEIQRNLNLPLEQQERMKQWLKNFAQSFSSTSTRLSADYKDRDYVHYSIMLDPDSIPEEQLPPADQLLGTDGLQTFVDGWETGEPYPVHISRFKVQDRQLLIAAACPSGQLRYSTAFLVARRRRKNKSPAC